MTQTQVRKTHPEQFVFFWGGIYSQWLSAAIEIAGEPYNCNEQYMMVQKARCFGDIEAEQEILATTNPSKQKAIGRRVKNFDPVKWNEISRLVVYRANFAKFTQHPDLGRQLLKTGDKWIVEASHEDKIWGIGLAEDDPRVYDPKQWLGTNWLGEAIMQVRSDIETLRKYGR